MSSCVWWGALGTSHKFNTSLCGRLWGGQGGSCTDATAASLPGTVVLGIAFFFNGAGAGLALWAARHLRSVPGMSGLMACGRANGSAGVGDAAVPYFYGAQAVAASPSAMEGGGAGGYTAPLIPEKVQPYAPATATPQLDASDTAAGGWN